MERAIEQAASGYNVYRSYDEPGGIRDELYEFAKKNAGFVKLAVIGHTIQGREIIALKVTQGAKGSRTASARRPCTCPTSTRASGSRSRSTGRFMHWIMDQRKAGNPEIVALLKSTELWFVIIANPDGYQYTFDHERLWRQNLRDNDGDGVDHRCRRRRPEPELRRALELRQRGFLGSSSSDTYRGTAARSEPETEAAAGLIDRIKPKFLVNFHSYGPLILYPQGWQIRSPDADNPIYIALAGTDANPGIPGFDPASSSDELYVTNGETTDYAETSVGAISFTPELERGLRRLRLRLPRRRGADPGGVPEDPCVRSRHRQVGRAPGKPGRTSGPPCSRSTSRRPRSIPRTAPLRCSISPSTSHTAIPRRSASSRSGVWGR